MAILFKKDWEDYPSAIADVETTNRSWVRMTGLFKYMGINNHLFPLALHNPDLQGIDPYADDLTDDQKVAIGIECRENVWYYFREVMRVPPPAGNNPLPFRANRGNISAIWLAMNHITTMLIQIRQTGKSLTGDGLDSYGLNIQCSNTDIALITKDDPLRTKTAKQVKELIELLPGYLQFMGKKDIKNTERLTAKALHNTMSISVAQKDRKAADNLGRGLTTPWVRVDEFAYIYNLELTLPTLLAATTAASETAKEIGAPYHTMFTTTPGKLNTPEGAFAYKVYKESMRWNESYFDAEDEDSLNKLVRRHTRDYEVVLLEYNHRQLGYTDEWLKERIKKALSTGENAESDFLNKWVGGNNFSPIPKNLLNIIVASKKNEFNPFVSKNGYILKWYVSPTELKDTIKNKFLVIGLDTSDALGGKNDAIGLVIRDSSTGAVIGTGKYNETNLTSFAEFLVSILEYLPKSVLVPERRSSAVAILDTMFRIMLLKRINPFTRIFNKIVHESDTNSNILATTVNVKVPSLSTLDKHKRAFGFATSGSGDMSRALLYGNVFRSSLNFTADKVYDQELIDQLAGLKVVNNRIDHEAGNHDDLVVGWLLCFWFLQHGKNKKLYGLKSTNVLNMVIDNELMADNPNVDKAVIDKQNKLKSEIELLIKRMSATLNVHLGRKILTRIRMLQSKMDTTIIRTFNVDALLADIKLYKVIKKK